VSDPQHLLKDAFKNQYNLILLAGAVALSAALESVAPAAIGLAAEIAWLLGARSKVFRRWAASRASQVPPSHQAPTVTAAPPLLDDTFGPRVEAIRHLVDQIRRLAAERAPHLAVLDDGGDRLAVLVDAFTRMTLLSQRLARFLAGSGAARIEDQVESIQRELAAEKSAGVRLSLRQALAVARRRCKQREHLQSTHRALEARMQTLEMSLNFLLEQLRAGSAEADLANQFDELGGVVSLLPPFGDQATAMLTLVRQTAAQEVPA
jgi:hypothetical protein